MLRLLTLLFFVIIAYLVYTYVIKSTLQQSSLLINISRAKAQRFGLILDVRTPKEREELGYYPNSIPVSMNELQTEVPFLLGTKPNDLSEKKTNILIYSTPGDRRAENAAEILYQMGYRNVRYINQSFLRLLPGSQ
jgi:rhodanese-related sulfurtransferase